ncbi:mitogen-activated protein kinase binding protein 1, partial [Lunasporangiospora selenospora]
LRHIKFWYLNAPKKVGSSSFVQVLDGRSGILGEMRDCNFVDAVCSPEGRFTYAVSSNGTLCLFTEGRVLEKWVDLHVRGAYSVNLEERCVVCACTDGMIRLFEHGTLEYIGTLPKPPPLGAFPGTIDNAKEESPQDPETALYADVLASQFDASSNSLVCIYSDRSLLVWDMQDHKNAVLSRSHLFHSDCVWGAEMLPEPVKEGEAKAKFPEGTFITYSADGTIKFWDLEDNASVSQPEGKAPEAEETPAPSTPHKDLLMVLYVDDNTKAWIQVPEHQDGIEPGFNLVPLECGIRTARISTDGRYLASGDKGGNLRVHDLATFSQITYQEAHDSEIMAIDFTDSNVDAPLLVATAGRDRLVHVFDAVNDYALLQTLDDHSSSITSIKFTANGSRMMSCGADKSIIFRNCNKSADGMTFQPYHQAPGRATFFDMGMHNNSQTVSVVSGDRRFNVFTLDSGKPIKSFKAEIKGDEAVAGMVDMCSMTHLSLDPTGTIAAACGSDKSIRIYDMLTGTCLGQMICHSELVTSVRFSNNFERIISTSADGCILVWRLNKDLVRRIQHRIDDNITLPTYIQNKTADPPAAASSPQSTVASRVRKTRLRQSTDRLSTHTSEYTNTSRRNSATSLASDDDSRADEHADDWNASHARKPTGPRSEDPSKINFAPVTVSKAAHLSPASPSMGATSTSTPRTRVAAAKTPITRSRHNSASQPATPKSTTTVRTSSHASSMTTGSDKPAVARAKAADTASESKDAHGDDAKSPKKEATEAEEEDVGDELSDELESHQDAESTAKVEVETLVDEDQPVTTKPTLHRSASDDGSNSVREASSAATNSVTEDDEPTENEEGGSDARDVDVDDEDDESVSDPGSDIDGQSKSRQRTISEISLSLTGGVKSSFQEGESLLDSPSQGGSSAASSRALSMARLPTSTRHSLSAKFLMSHAAMLMMGLVKSRREQDAREAQGELGESALLERDVESNSSTPRPGPHHSRGDSMSELDAGREVPLEERLNTNSLNMVVAKRKLGSIIKSVAQTQREQNGNGQPAPVEDSDAHPKQRMLSSGGRSGDLAEEVERTRKRLIELGYLTTSGGSIPVPAAATETELAEEATKTSASSMDLSGKSQSDEAAGEPEDKILASPALVSSPTGVIPPPSALSASISERLLSRSSSSEVGGLAVMENEEEPVKEGLQDALERISILIANKAVVSG